MPHIPISRIDELLDTWGFHKILVVEKSVPLTAFCTASGLHGFLVMHMGRSGSPGHFQRVMQQVTAELEDFVIISIDDVLVRNKDNLSMVDYIERFLEALTRHNLKISPSKSKIGAEQITFLVHTISPRGAKPDA